MGSRMKKEQPGTRMPMPMKPSKADPSLAAQKRKLIAAISETIEKDGWDENGALVGEALLAVLFAWTSHNDRRHSIGVIPVEVE